LTTEQPAFARVVQVESVKPEPVLVVSTMITMTTAVPTPMYMS
jgi:hypothetical protein